jgi:hypothetical protein
VRSISSTVGVPGDRPHFVNQRKEIKMKALIAIVALMFSVNSFAGAPATPAKTPAPVYDTKQLDSPTTAALYGTGAALCELSLRNHFNLTGPQSVAICTTATMALAMQRKNPNLDAAFGGALTGAVIGYSFKF